MLKRYSLALLLLVFPFSFETLAQGKNTPAISMAAYKKITEANLLIDEEKFTEAIEKLQELQEKRLSKYERAQTWYLLGSIYYRLENEKQTLESFTRVLDGAGSIPEYLELNVLKTLSQMHIVQENYPQALAYCTKMLELSEAPVAYDYALLAQIHYKLSNWAEAIKAINSGKAVAAEKGIIPSENLLILENAVYFELNDSHNMVITLKSLIKHYPKSTYLLYLASVYGQQEKTEEQTVIMESLYENDHLMQASQLSGLANLYMSLNVPYKAAKILEKGFEDGRLKSNVRNYEMLSQAWRMAAEINNAIDSLQSAANLSEDGAIYLQKAYLEYNSSQWQDTTESVMMALDRGLEKEEDQGDAWLLYGMALFNQSKFDQAIEACQKAAKFVETKAFAQQWINYISSERDKIAYFDPVTDFV